MKRCTLYWVWFPIYLLLQLLDWGLYDTSEKADNNLW